MHLATDDIADMKTRVPLDLPELLERPLLLLESEMPHRTEDLAFVQALADRLRCAVVEAAGELETGFCHEVLHGGNACLEDDIFTLFDFDYCGQGALAYELSVFPWAFAVGGQPAERIEEMARAFLAGYQKHRSVRPQDLAATAIFVALREFWLLGLHLRLGDRTGWSWIDDRYFDHHLKVLRDWGQDFLAADGYRRLLPVY